MLSPVGQAEKTKALQASNLKKDLSRCVCTGGGRPVPQVRGRTASGPSPNHAPPMPRGQEKKKGDEGIAAQVWARPAAMCRRAHCAPRSSSAARKRFASCASRFATSGNAARAASRRPPTPASHGSIAQLRACAQPSLHPEGNLPARAQEAAEGRQGPHVLPPQGHRVHRARAAAGEVPPDQGVRQEVQEGPWPQGELLLRAGWQPGGRAGRGG